MRWMRWLVVVAATVAVFGGCLWLFRFASWSWMPHATTDRWAVAAAFATVTAGVAGAAGTWWASQETLVTADTGDAAASPGVSAAGERRSPRAGTSAVSPLPATALLISSGEQADGSAAPGPAAVPGGAGAGRPVGRRGRGHQRDRLSGDDAVNVQYRAEQMTVLPEQAFGPWAGLAAPAGLSNLPRPGLFVGRESELAQLDAAMTGPGGVVVQAVHGLGGVGKSTLAAEWAAARAAEYSLTWWITAAARRISTPGWRAWRSRCSRRWPGCCRWRRCGRGRCSGWPPTTGGW